MAKLELDLKHDGVTVGSTSIDINSLPQFSLKYFSARPNKVPIPMNVSLISSDGGLDYVGPLQPRDGFLSGNTYSVEVTVLNAPVGTVVNLGLVGSTVNITHGLPDLTGSNVFQHVDIVPINEGKTNASGVAEFQVSFSHYPANRFMVHWTEFKWTMSTNRGAYTDPTPQAIVFGGVKPIAGWKQRLHLDWVSDQHLAVHPGQYGCWVDVFLGGGGGGQMNWSSANGANYVIGEDGGSVALFSANPRVIPYRHSPLYEAGAVDGIPISFAEGGASQKAVLNGMVGEAIRRGGVGAGSALVTAALEYFDYERLRQSGYLQYLDISIEVLKQRNGTTWTWSGASSGGQYYGAYADPVIDGDGAGGEGYARAHWASGIRCSGSGGMVQLRIHYRRKASGANLPIPALQLLFKAAVIDPYLSTREIKGTSHYNGDSYEIIPPHTANVQLFSDLNKVRSSPDGGKGGIGYDLGGQNGGVGSAGILDFGYYTTYA